MWNFTRMTSAVCSGRSAMLAHNRHPRFLRAVIVDLEPNQYAVRWNSPHLVLDIWRCSSAFSQWRLQEVWLYTSENLPHFCSARTRQCGCWAQRTRIAASGIHAQARESFSIGVQGQLAQRGSMLPTTLWGKSPCEVAESVVRRPQNTSSWSGSEAEFRDAVCDGVLRNSTFIP